MNIDGIFFKIGLDLKEVQDGLRNAAKSIEDSLKGPLAGVGKQLEDIGSGMTKALTIPIVALGGFALKTFGDFEASMKRVEGITGITGDALKKLTDQAIELGIKTQFSAKDAADAMASLAAKGLLANEIFTAMPGVLNLAAAGQISMAKAGEIAAGVIRGFGLAASDMGRATDILAKAAVSGGASISELGTSFRYVGPIAANTGIAIEQVAAAFALMAEAGVKGQKAGTGFRAFILDLGKSAKDGGNAIEEMGYKITDANGKLLPLSDIIRNLSPMLKNAGDLTKAFGVHQSEVIPLLKAGADGFDNMTASIKKAEEAGFGTTLAKKLHEGWKGVFDDLKSSIETAMIAIGEVIARPAADLSKGFLEPMVNMVTSIAQAFGKLPQPVQTAAVAFLALVAAAGPAMILMGKFIEIMEALAVQSVFTRTIDLFTASWSSLGAVLSANLPIILAIGAAWLTWEALSGIGDQFRILNTNVPELAIGMKALKDEAALVVDEFVAWISKQADAAGNSRLLKGALGELRDTVVGTRKEFQFLGSLDWWSALKSAINPLFAVQKGLSDINAAFQRMRDESGGAGSTLAKMSSDTLALQKAYVIAAGGMKTFSVASLEAQLRQGELQIATVKAAGEAKVAAAQHEASAKAAAAAAVSMRAAAEAASKGVAAVAKIAADEMVNLKAKIVAAGIAFANLIPPNIADVGVKSIEEMAQALDDMGLAFPPVVAGWEELRHPPDIKPATLSLTEMNLELNKVGLGFEYVKKSADTVPPALSECDRIMVDFGKNFTTAITDFADGLLGIGTKTKSLSQTFLDLGKSIARAFVNMEIKEGLKALMGDLTGLQGMLGNITKSLSGLFGGGSSAASGAGGGGGSALGSATGGAGGVGGTLGAISSVTGIVTGIVSSISGIFTALSTHTIASDTGKIEVNTRSCWQALINMQATFNQYLPNLLNTKYLMDLEPIYEALVGGGNNQLFQSMETFRLTTGTQLAAMNAMLGSLIKALFPNAALPAGSGTSTATLPRAGAGQQTTSTFNVHVQQTTQDPYVMGTQVAQGLNSALPRAFA